MFFILAYEILLKKYNSTFLSKLIDKTNSIVPNEKQIFLNEIIVTDIGIIEIPKKLETIQEEVIIEDYKYKLTNIGIGIDYGEKYTIIDLIV